METFFRGRRLRRNRAIRSMMEEVSLRPSNLMMGYVVVETDDNSFRRPIPSLPGMEQLSIGQLEVQVEKAVDNGLVSLMLFGVPAHKDPVGSGAYADDGIIQQAVRRLKDRWPELQVATDVCLCEYTSHGHCGLLAEGDVTGRVLNDPTLELIARTAVSHARAGSDLIAPSDMMDGRIQAIRSALDGAGFQDLPVMSYAVKYASAYYGPFRDAAESCPQFGDRRTYQMDPARIDDGLREAQADIEEGADIIMIKPAGPCADMIVRVAERFDVPVAAYQVSGEYTMIRAAAQHGWINEEAIIMESLVAIRRAGARLILSYFTEELLEKGLVR